MVLTPERAPNATGYAVRYAVRFVRSIKEECLDRIIPFGERHLRHLIAKFVDHDHRWRERNHHGLADRLIVGTPATDRTSRVRHRQRFGRLLNFYERAACRRVRRELDHYAVRSSPGGSAAAQIR